MVKYHSSIKIDVDSTEIKLYPKHKMYNAILILHIVFGVISFLLVPVFLAVTKETEKFSIIKNVFSLSIFSTMSLGGLIVIMGGNFTRTCAMLLAYSVVMLGILNFGSRRSKKFVESQ